MIYKNEAKEGVCEEWFYLSLEEVSYSFGVEAQTILAIIDEGIISAKKNSNNEWEFDSEALRQIRTVLDLTKDLGVNLAGAGLALELLNEIERLKCLINMSSI